MRGFIDADLQAVVPLTVTRGTRTETVEFIIDTGFSGFLSVSPAMVERFNRPVGGIQQGVTADGRIGFFEVVDVSILWHGRAQIFEAQVLDEPLIGTRLLHLQHVSMDWKPGAEFGLKPILQS